MTPSADWQLSHDFFQASPSVASLSSDSGCVQTYPLPRLFLFSLLSLLSSTVHALSWGGLHSPPSTGFFVSGFSHFFSHRQVNGCVPTCHGIPSPRVSFVNPLSDKLVKPGIIPEMVKNLGVTSSAFSLDSLPLSLLSKLASQSVMNCEAESRARKRKTQPLSASLGDERQGRRPLMPLPDDRGRLLWGQGIFHFSCGFSFLILKILISNNRNMRYTQPC